MKKYVLIVRDNISTTSPQTDETLNILDCYYKSPEFLSDGTQDSLNAAIDKYQSNFNHFKKWSAELVEVK